MEKLSDFRQYPSSMPTFADNAKRYISSFNNAEPAMLGFSDWNGSALRSPPSIPETNSFFFSDNGAGAQVSQIVLESVHDHLLEAQRGSAGGRYRRSQGSGRGNPARTRKCATFLNARDPREWPFA